MTSKNTRKFVFCCALILILVTTRLHDAKCRKSLPVRVKRSEKSMMMLATGYCRCRVCCGRYADGRTATGAIARHGVCAVDKRIVPLGTRLYIPGYGTAIACDTGSAIKGNRIDLCFDSHKQALEFGRKRLKVTIKGRSK